MLEAVEEWVTKKVYNGIEDYEGLPDWVVSFLWLSERKAIISARLSKKKLAI